jgi:hypothetical protein
LYATSAGRSGITFAVTNTVETVRSKTISRRAKTSGLILLSVLMIYSGAVWGLRKCLLEERGIAAHAHVASVALQPVSPLPISNLGASHARTSMIHCVAGHGPLGAMIVSSSDSRSIASEAKALWKSLRIASRLSSIEGSLLLSRSLPDGLGSAPSRSSITRHLFLSVFRI